VLPDRDAALVLVEPLTERELDVLRLMASRLSNKEVADRLNISWHTAGKHASNIYQKLQVPGRRAAVERARRLGLLPTT
jgi:LuxR family maltose regulon positive regulatory protein